MTDTIQVISDFDMTLTRFAYNGKRCPPSHNILNNSRLISEECKAQLKDLLNTYYPIEIDSKWTVEEKLPLMVDWWTKAHTGAAAHQERPAAGCGEGHPSAHLLCWARRRAGGGDPPLVFHPNVKVFSNYMDFDETGVEERKTSYLNAYDIVLVKDETMEVPNALLLCFGVALPRSYS
uniref:5'-nucleotidase n=1 Tax=Oncorhynchus mykiss TaxID=8022 RepID=A0A8K9WVS1_ONCMY